MTQTKAVRSKPTRRAPEHYVNNKEFSQAVVDYVNAVRAAEGKGKETPKITEYIGRCFLKIAEGFGCVGIRVTKAADLHDAIKRGIAMNKPVVIDVVTDMYAIAPHPWTPVARDFHSYQKS